MHQGHRGIGILSALSVAATVLGIVLSTPLTAGAQTGAEEPFDPKQLVNPVPYTRASLSAGRKHYLRHCQSCHGVDGRALENIDFEATDLTAPSRWRYGSSDGETFVTLRDGAGDDMPPFRSQLDDEELWQVVNYLRSLGPESERPALVADGEQP